MTSVLMFGNQFKERPT